MLGVATTVQQHPSSADAYIRHGWSLVPIPTGSKGPRTPGWNLKENSLKSQVDLPTGYGIGLAHAYSGTMALDIDNWSMTASLLSEKGINLQELYDAPDAVSIDSGREGRGKLLYMMPFGVTLPSKKIIHQSTTAFELRCATVNGLTVQDVLPPSVHPTTGNSYQWGGRGNWERLPVIPQVLLDLWSSYLELDNDRVIATGGPIAASWQEVKQALDCIPSECSRDEWVSVGMALQWAASQTDQYDQALQLWNDWSATAQTKYPGVKEIIAQWKSFRPEKVTLVTLGTLFHIAAQHGYVRPAPDVSHYFKSIDSTPLSPLDLIKGLRLPPPDIDIDLFPSIVGRRAQEISEGVGCDPLVPLWAGLGAVCGAIDARTRLELMPGYKVPPVLWLMTLGDPADKKSPGSRPMFGALKDIEASDRVDYQKRKLDWEAREAIHTAAKKAFLDFNSKLDQSPDAIAPPVPELPTPPVPLKITVSDITSQKLVRNASERPRGLLCYLDEMNSWIGKLTDKMSGEDRSAWVVSYESERYEMDRVSSGSIYCENLAVSIYGNIQPAVFRNNVSALSQDGLLQRFIPAILRPGKTRLGNPVPEFLSTQGEWDQLLHLIYALPHQTYKLTPESYDLFREFQLWYEAAKQDERLLHSSDIFMTGFGKLEGTAGRLILLFHVIENPYQMSVSVELVDRVIRLIKSYIIPSLRYLFSDVDGSVSFDRWITDYIIHHADKQTITLRDLKQGGRRQLAGVNSWQQNQMVFTSMQMLETTGWVLRLDDGSREHQHVAKWAINPALVTQFTEYRQSVIAAKQRQIDEIYKLSPKEKPKVYGNRE